MFLDTIFYSLVKFKSAGISKSLSEKYQVLYQAADYLYIPSLVNCWPQTQCPEDQSLSGRPMTII